MRECYRFEQEYPDTTTGNLSHGLFIHLAKVILYEIWGFHGGEYLDCGVLDHDTTWSC
jgi:hypothetical protein